MARGDGPGAGPRIDAVGRRGRPRGMSGGWHRGGSPTKRRGSGAAGSGLGDVDRRDRSRRFARMGRRHPRADAVARPAPRRGDRRTAPGAEHARPRRCPGDHRLVVDGVLRRSRRGRGAARWTQTRRHQPAAHPSRRPAAVLLVHRVRPDPPRRAARAEPAAGGRRAGPGRDRPALDRGEDPCAPRRHPRRHPSALP